MSSRKKPTWWTWRQKVGWRDPLHPRACRVKRALEDYSLAPLEPSDTEDSSPDDSEDLEDSGGSDDGQWEPKPIRVPKYILRYKKGWEELDRRGNDWVKLLTLLTQKRKYRFKYTRIDTPCNAPAGTIQWWGETSNLKPLVAFDLKDYYLRQQSETYAMDFISYQLVHLKRCILIHMFQSWLIPDLINIVLTYNQSLTFKEKKHSRKYNHTEAYWYMWPLMYPLKVPWSVLEPMIQVEIDKH